MEDVPGLRRADVYSLDGWRQVFTRVETWRPLVRLILARHGLPADLTLSGVTPGSHAVFGVGERLIVKIYSPLWPADWAKETELYALLGGDPFLRVPRLVASGVIPANLPEAAGGEWPYALVERQAGTPLGQVWRAMDAGGRARLAGRLGRLLARLHRTPVEGLRSVPSGPSCWTGFAGRQALSAMDRHRAWNTLPVALLAQVASYLVAQDGLWRAAGTRVCLLHCDVTADHVFVGASTGACGAEAGNAGITGLIDFGDAMAGDPEYEFVAVFLSALDGDRAALASFLQSYGHPAWDDPGFSRRMLAYCLIHEFDVLAEIPRLWPDLLDSVASLDELAAAVWGPPSPRTARPAGPCAGACRA